jgi:hypothetical protein
LSKTSINMEPEGVGSDKAIRRLGIKYWIRWLHYACKSARGGSRGRKENNSAFKVIS